MGFKLKQRKAPTLESGGDTCQGCRDPGGWARRKGRALASSKMWRRRLPILGFLHGYNWLDLLHDVIAGLTAGLTELPHYVAAAVVAGLPPQYGLYSSFMGSFVYMILGSCNVVTIGPTLITAMLLKRFAKKFGPKIAITFTFYSGCFISLLAILKLGFLVDFISAPVLDGFISAGLISIATSQLQPLLGLHGDASTWMEHVSDILGSIADIKLWDTVLGVTCIVVLLLLRHLRKYAEATDGAGYVETIWRTAIKYASLSRNAIVVIVSTTWVGYMASDDGVPPVEITGKMPDGLPEFTIPNFEIIYHDPILTGKVVSELLSAMTIPMFLLLKSIAVPTAFSDGKAVDGTQEMIAVGISNILGSFVQSMPVTASFTRTAINNASCLRTPIAGLFSGLLVLLIISVFTPVLTFIPKATLAALVICAVVLMIDLHNTTITLWRSKKSDLIPLYVTFLGCLFIALDYGMIIGILTNFLLILYDAARPAMAVEIKTVASCDMVVVTPDRSVTYPAAHFVKNAITKSSHHEGKGMLVVVDGTHVQDIDSTAAKVLKSLLDEMKVSNQRIVLWNWKRSIIKTFEKYVKKELECFQNGESLKELLLDGAAEAEAPAQDSLSSSGSSSVWTSGSSSSTCPAPP